jgi:sulfur relay (sulfurtransferase) complex TusBCD TusD component (DsrE family)
LVARGIDEKLLVVGARRSSLEELTDSTLWADRTLCF